jgi:hypothetical protein
MDTPPQGVLVLTDGTTSHNHLNQSQPGALTVDYFTQRRAVPAIRVTKDNVTAVVGWLHDLGHDIRWTPDREWLLDFRTDGSWKHLFDGDYLMITGKGTKIERITTAKLDEKYAWLASAAAPADGPVHLFLESR